MTGFGHAEGETAGWRLTAELRSVNHRGLDVRVSVPPFLSRSESILRDHVRARCRRGRVELRLSVEPPGVGGVSPVVLEQAHRIYETAKAVHTHLALDAPITLRDLVSAGLELSSVREDPPEALEACAVAVVDSCLEALLAAREEEGSALRREFLGRLERVAALVDTVEALAHQESLTFRERVTERLAEILGTVESAGAIDQERLTQELVTLLDRSDITEEVVRARTHVDALRQLFEEDNPAGQSVGKRVDFFLQELIREANTMASKSISAELTGQVVDIKVEIERMREQAHNIE